MAKRRKKKRKPTQKIEKAAKNKPQFSPDEILKRTPRKPNLNPSKFELTQESYYSGIFPPPEMLREFEEVLPGSAERIFSMAESQSGHRIKQEDKVVTSNISRAGKGQWLAFIVAMTVIIGSLYAVIIGRELSGFGGILVTLVSLASVFVYERRKGGKELEEKKNRKK